MNYTISLGKEKFKFSSSHFTILDKNKAERLHGHNYHVVCDLNVTKINPALGMAFDFNKLKPYITKICEHLDEYVLIPKNSPYVKIQNAKGQCLIQFGKKQYNFPKEDVRLLEVSNITVEELARYFWEKLKPKLHKDVKGMSITVTETQGQSVKFEGKI